MSDAIKREVGDNAKFVGGKDYAEPLVRVITSMNKDASDNEKALFISQGKDHKLSISLPTLEMIVKWAKKQDR
jgi:hypothetical protein